MARRTSKDEVQPETRSDKVDRIVKHMTEIAARRARLVDMHREICAGGDITVTAPDRSTVFVLRTAECEPLRWAVAKAIEQYSYAIDKEILDNVKEGFGLEP